MTSLESFVLRVKPALDSFLRTPSKATVNTLHNELQYLKNIPNIQTFNTQLLLPLILKLEEFGNKSLVLRTSCLQCITLVLRYSFLKECVALRTILIVIIKQIKSNRDQTTCNNNISEEIKMAAIECITMALKRSTTDVLEQFYNKETSMILGQILLILVEFIETERYKTLLCACMECIMTVFYVHNDADVFDVVLRHQVANCLFIFLPKIVTILYKTALADEKLGNSLKQLSIKTLSRILCLIFEDNTENTINIKYDANAFNNLLKNIYRIKTSDEGKHINTPHKSLKTKNNELKQLHDDGITDIWLQTTSQKLRHIFLQLSVLRSHRWTLLRQEYAKMCCQLSIKCCVSLKDCFIIILENVMALTEDDDLHIQQLCRDCIDQLQHKHSIKQLFNDNAEQLFDEHLINLPRIINQCDSSAQYTEFIFLKAFLKSITSDTLITLLTIPQNMERFLLCLVMAVKLDIPSDILKTEYHNTYDCCNDDRIMKLSWRKFHYVTCDRCIHLIQDICEILGNTLTLNQLMLDYLIELYKNQDAAEILNNTGAFLIMLWLSTPHQNPKQTILTTHLLELLLNEQHWHLSAQPDIVTNLKYNKPTKWITDYTPGLYESAVEIRIQDINDSDDENENDCNKVTGIEAQINVLHTCVILDALGHCALYLDTTFTTYIFRTLYKILLKLANENVMVHQAALFGLKCVQKALKYTDYQNLIDQHMDYIEHHINNMLKKNIDTEAALNILYVLLKFNSRHSITYYEHIFQTIYEQCTKMKQQHYITSYLRLFSNFLKEFKKWSENCIKTKTQQQPKEYNDKDNIDKEILKLWLDELLSSNTNENENLEQNDNHNKLSSNKIDDTSHHGKTNADNDKDMCKDDSNSEPHHIVMIKLILNQVIKYVHCKEQMHTIVAMECLIYGLPLLQHYDNILLPMVHNLWKPFVEKLHQDDIIIMNRCFKLLLILAIYAKDFITKRCLDNVIPFLKSFLKKASNNSRLLNNNINMTQEYKLQFELLEQLPIIIECLEIDGKPLNEINEIVALYISREQPKDLQSVAVNYFKTLLCYNGPMMNVMLLKNSSLPNYEENCNLILNEILPNN